MKNDLDVLITDHNFDIEPIPFTENVFDRRASRGVVYNPKTDQVVMVTFKHRVEYKLPGGGREGNETEEETFYREIMEETGCKVKIVQRLGVVREERSQIDMKQTSAAFVAELIEDTGEIHPDADEIKKGLAIEWMDLDDAIVAVENSFTTVLTDPRRSIYRARFVLERDLAILKAYKELKQKRL